MKYGQSEAFTWDVRLLGTLCIVSIAMFMDSLDVAIVNVALPSIQHSLVLSTTDLTWVQGAYALAYAGFLLLGGRAADQFGRRRILLAGISLLGCASLVGGVAQVAWLLILVRLLQGVGAALTIPAAISIVTTAIPEGGPRNKAFGVIGAMVSGGFSFGLVCGALLTGFINWHWVFFVNVIIMIPLFISTLLIVRPDQKVTTKRSADTLGAITGTAGLLLLVYTITHANEAAATPLETVGLGLGALLLLVAFVVIEHRATTPLLPLRIFRLQTLRTANLVCLTAFGSLFSFLFIATLYMQNIGHYTPIQSGFALLPMALLSVLVSQFVPARIVAHFGVKTAVALGLFLIAIGVLIFSRIGLVADYIDVILPGSAIIGGLGIGIAYSSLSIAAVTGVANEEQGLAAAILSTSMQVGGGLGLAIVVAVVNAVTLFMSRNAPGSPIAAQVQGFHVGLYLIMAFALLGALMALVGMRERKARGTNEEVLRAPETIQISQK
jgi:EmrB/QacA subfamily drug resistance transporter